MEDKRPAAWVAVDVDECSDEQLVDGLRAGERAAFAGLHDRYAPGIYNLALRLVRHGHDAEDITQDVLIRAYERVPREREVLLKAWLYRLTVNRCYDHLRSSARRRPAEPGPGESLVAAGDPYEQAATARLFETALASLTDRQRAAILLKDVHGLTIAEVAVALEVTPGSVEVLLARARKSFRASYAGLCGGDRAACSAGAIAALAALPQYPLPAALQALPLAAPPPVVALPAAPPAGLVAGGLGATLFTPPALKAAAVLLAAAVTVTTASTTTSRAPAAKTQRPVAASAQGAARSKPAAAKVARATSSPRPSPSATGALGVAPPSPSSSPPSDPSTTPTPSPSPTVYGVPSPSPEPSTSPEPSASPEPSPDPTPSAGPTADPAAPSPSSSPLF